MADGPVLIAGGGIGGLTAAVALRQAGFEVQVFEQAEEIREIGAGIAISPNAISALRRIGLDQALPDALQHGPGVDALRCLRCLRQDGHGPQCEQGEEDQGAGAGIEGGTPPSVPSGRPS